MNRVTASLRVLVTLAVVAFCAHAALAQTTSSAPAKPTFDVATIKPSPPLDIAKVQAEMQAGKMPKVGPHVTASQAEYNYMSLKELIGMAYNVRTYQITGPDWLATERFDIVARMPEGATKDDAPAMLQALLQDRFRLTAHRDTEEHPALALIVGKGGPKLKEATAAPVPFDESTPLKPGEMQLDTPEGPARVTRNPDGSTFTNMGLKGTYTQKMEAQMLHLDANLNMKGFVVLLNQVMQIGGANTGRQVVDRTGLDGYYHVTLDLSLADLIASARAQGMNVPGAPSSNGMGEASDPSGGANVSSSVQALGLKLDPRREPVEQLIVDHIEKIPTEN
jgi:uncharacterized protein (TIGR03435 family)